ncbi:two-component system response regulator [Ideonella sp. A 288]|uniref:response regulator n=1 Tax=Ideonella sp. A 288 TaxID=1962181 RepID=UPI000B4AF254|nr:two-component system response regulator [Ideonella sp. A 288]
MTPALILVVDDNPENLTVLCELLHDQYSVRAANSGPRALQLAAQSPHPNLILLDVMMPGMSGYEVLETLRAGPETCDIPVIFTTALSATEDEQHGLVLGAVDYITKPLRPAIVLARVHNHLELARARATLRHHNAALEAEVQHRMRENQLIQEVSIRALARLAETRDNETGNHLLRTQAYVRVLGQQLKNHARFCADLDDRTIDLIAKSAPLHDIGKVGIPDHVLLKPGKLTPDEWEVMKTHAQMGADAIARAESDAEQQVQFLAYAKDIAAHHHERWDGKGYPDGLAGDDIPVPARLMALADVFDALISRRVYKPPMSFEAARDVIVSERGTHFDPDVTDAFVARFDEFCAVARRHSDEQPSATDDPAQ